jgi:biotin carboxylase
MNTRIQVEHGVTEMVTSIDLVKESIRLAAGEPLGLKQRQIGFEGTAIECRVYAEDPDTQLPSPGVVTNHHSPGGLGVRVETALYDGYRVPVHYDPLIASSRSRAPKPHCASISSTASRRIFRFICASSTIRILPQVSSRRVSSNGTSHASRP